MLIIFAFLVVAWFLYTQYSKKSTPTEPYMTAGAMDHSGTFAAYEPMAPAEEEQYSPSYFADLVTEGDVSRDYRVSQPETSKEVMSPMERVQHLSESMMPRISTNVTPYNLDLANPKTYQFMVSAPRVHLKPKLQDGSLLTALRGNIPTKYHPNIAMVERSQYGVENIRHDGIFSDNSKLMYDRITKSGYKNYPMHVSGYGPVGGYGSGGELIMDMQE